MESTPAGISSLVDGGHPLLASGNARNLGIAVYASSREDVGRIFDLIGHDCDHIHVDLIDETVDKTAAPVRLSHLGEVRSYWPGHPVCLHVMSGRPRRWIEQTWDQVDWYLVSCDADDDLSGLVCECRARGKKVGVVWRQGLPVSGLLPHLPHVDFVTVMGIARLGSSGQPLDTNTLKVARALDSVQTKYRYELIFDGGVTVENVSRIPGRFIVSASAILNSSAPRSSAQMIRRSRYIPPDNQRRAA